MSRHLRWHGIQILTALIAALALVSLGIRANIARADEPMGEEIEVPAPAPAPPRVAPPPPAPPPAAEKNYHLYLSGMVGGEFAKGESSGSIAGVANFGKDNDEDVFGGGALGLHYDGSPVGVRVEFEAQAARDIDLNTLGRFPLDSELHTWTMLGNIWLDCPITDVVSIFGGGGLGMAVTDMTTTIFYGVGDKTRNDTTFAWQVGGGLSFAATDWLTFDTSYRFVDLGQPDLKYRVYAFPSDLEMQLHSHDVVFGVRMNFFSF
jgi:opacity protein-like surface antigen